MLSTVFRSLNAVFGVVVAVLVTQRFSDSNKAKLLTVVITSSVVALSEGLMIWAPKRFAFARRLLDARATFTGTWVQEVVRAHGARGPKEGFANDFAVFTVAYLKQNDNYKVDGTAYTKDGVEHARWNSTDVVHFARDGQSMTYEWKGSVTNPEVRDAALDRTGFARIGLTATDGGKARVDHVGEDISLEINVSRITTAWLTRRKLGQFSPKALEHPSERDQFALAFAKARR